MGGGWLGWPGVLIIAVLWAAAGHLEAQAQGSDDLAAIRGQVSDLLDQGKYSKALPIAERYVAEARQRHGEDHFQFAAAIGWLASTHHFLGRYADAEPLWRRALAITEKEKGPDHLHVAFWLNNLAQTCGAQYRYLEAERIYKRTLIILERDMGPEHWQVGSRLHDLAVLYHNQGRYAEAEPLYKRALAISERAQGSDHIGTGTTLNNLGGLYQDQGRTAEAEALYKRALAIAEKALGPDHPNVGIRLNSLAGLYRGQGRAAEAEALYRRALIILEKALGPDHPSVGNTLSYLALAYEFQGRMAEAEQLFKRALAIKENLYGSDSPAVGWALASLASHYFTRSDWERAVDYWRRSTDVIAQRAKRATTVVNHTLTDKVNVAEEGRYQFRGLVKAVHRMGRGAGSAGDMFEVAQRALGSEAAASLAQMAARGAKGDTKLAALVRERQDLVEEWQKREGDRTASVAQPSDKRDRAAHVANVARLDVIDGRIAEIDKQLSVEFQDYSALATPSPLSVEEVQSQLGAGEALILFLDTSGRKPTPEETFIWVVTKTDVRWVRSDLGTPALTREVAALRCGLDAALWDEESGALKCGDLLKTAPQRDARSNIRWETLPFDKARAHVLYKALFGQIEDLIRGKHLLIVPSGPLTQLPFQVLVTASTMGDDYGAAAWLSRSHAITVLPAVSSLKALRRVAKASVATKPMLGIGNPLLDGNPAEVPDHAKWAAQAQQKQFCEGLQIQQADAGRRGRGVRRVTTHSGRANFDHLRSQSPLPDTADELCAVAKDLKLASEDILLAARATEAIVKELSADGRLAQYRVLHFATHGTIAGEIEGTSEPGLILTPPKDQSELDDGYLSASEVAALKLDADWVILSACNTAAGGAQGAEALSGLARAFIYAGARALLVSHWQVDSLATVKLITLAVGGITRDAKLGRAEALRRAMLTMIDAGGREAHPALWAPFVVVGEGAATG